MRIEIALKQAQSILRNKNFKTAGLDCEILMSKVLDKDRKYIILNPKKNLENHKLAYFNSLVKERSQDRKSKIGTGDRSERIRTYNFPQGRVTDHRINLTLHKLEEFLEGEAFDEMIESLTLQAQEESLSNLK